MRRASTTLLVLSMLAFTAAIWAPGMWWQWLLTAVVLMIAAAAASNAADAEPHRRSRVHRDPRNTQRENRRKQ